MRKLLIAALTVLALGALTTAPALAAPPPGLPPGGGGGEEAITVNCPADSIQDAVDLATAGTPLTITVSGTCTEEVVITADDVTIQGNSVADEVVGGFTITGAQRVRIKTLSIKDGANNGVAVRRGATVVLDVLEISGHSGSGILVAVNATAVIVDSMVVNPFDGGNALALIDGGVVRVFDSTFLSESTASDDGAAVGLFRLSSVRFDGANEIKNTVGGLAMQVQHTSNLRVHNGIDVVGDVIITNNSAIWLREVNVDGDIMVEHDSNLTLRANVPVVVTGSVTIEDQSLLRTDGSAGNMTIMGGVTCPGGLAGGVVNSAVIVGMITDCALF